VGDFKNGVKWFLVGEMKIRVNFPEGIVKCKYCPFVFEEKGLNRFWCKITGQMLYTPFVLDLPDSCPIVLTGEIVGVKEEKSNV
jgi:hypothetical protein